MDPEPEALVPVFVVDDEVELGVVVEAGDPGVVADDVDPGVVVVAAEEDELGVEAEEPEPGVVPEPPGVLDCEPEPEAGVEDEELLSVDDGVDDAGVPLGGVVFVDDPCGGAPPAVAEFAPVDEELEEGAEEDDPGEELGAPEDCANCAIC